MTRRNWRSKEGPVAISDGAFSNHLGIVKAFLFHSMRNSHTRSDPALSQFPLIHTNCWDAILAVPAVLIITQFLKIFSPIPRPYIPSLATVTGLVISIFVSHRHDLAPA